MPVKQAAIQVSIVLAALTGSGCVLFQPLKIKVPDELQGSLRMPVSGGEKSWNLSFGPYLVTNIQDRPGRVLYTDFKSSYYDIQAFEFQLTDVLGNSWDCWCEYPIIGPGDERIRCTLQESANPLNKWDLVDTTLSRGEDWIGIQLYYKQERKSFLPESVLMGYTFNDAVGIIGLVDISGIWNEAFLLKPELDYQKSLPMIGAAAALIVKHRKLNYNQSFESQKIRPDVDYP